MPYCHGTGPVIALNDKSSAVRLLMSARKRGREPEMEFLDNESRCSLDNLANSVGRVPEIPVEMSWSDLRLTRLAKAGDRVPPSGFPEKLMLVILLLVQPMPAQEQGLFGVSKFQLFNELTARVGLKDM
jgi:hypothetical protein